MEGPGQKHVIVMGEDEMAFMFTDPPADAGGAEENAHVHIHSLADRLLREFKSFLPTVSRVRPVEAVFASGKCPAGKIVRLVAPAQPVSGV